MHGSTKKWLERLEREREAYLVESKETARVMQQLYESVRVNDGNPPDGPCYWNLFDTFDPEHIKFLKKGWIGIYFSRLSEMEYEAVVKAMPKAKIFKGAFGENSPEYYQKQFWKDMSVWVPDFAIIDAGIAALKTFEPRNVVLEFGKHAARDKVIAMLEGENYRMTKESVSFSNDDLAPLVRMFTG